MSFLAHFKLLCIGHDKNTSPRQMPQQFFHQPLCVALPAHLPRLLFYSRWTCYYQVPAFAGSIKVQILKASGELEPNLFIACCNVAAQEVMCNSKDDPSQNWLTSCWSCRSCFCGLVSGATSPCLHTWPASSTCRIFTCWHTWELKPCCRWHQCWEYLLRSFFTPETMLISLFAWLNWARKQHNPPNAMTNKVCPIFSF